MFQGALVLFLGGYTLAEVAAFRFCSACFQSWQPCILCHRWLQTVTGYQFVVAGTNSFGGNKLAADIKKL